MNNNNNNNSILYYECATQGQVQYSTAQEHKTNKKNAINKQNHLYRGDKKSHLRKTT
jgi:hypothetical protein